MGGKSKSALDAKRKNMFMVPADKLVIIGLDTKDGPEHPLYDQRIELPLDPYKVLNVANGGIMEPVIGRKDGNQVLVVDGRQRVRWAREANKEKAKNGEALIEVPTILREGTLEGAMAVMVSANEIRTDDSPSVRAGKAVALANRGKTPGDIAMIFGISVVYACQLLKFGGAAKFIRDAVDAGRLSMSAALPLLDFPEAEQKDKLQILLDSGHATAANARRVASGKTTKTKSKREARVHIPVKLFKKILEAVKGELKEELRAFWDE